MSDGPKNDDPTRAQSAAGASHDEAALAERLKRLGEGLEAHPAAVVKEVSSGSNSGYARAVKIASEFVAGVVVGGGVGWGIDRLAGTAPWALIVFLLLGFAAGVLNVLRSEGLVAEAALRPPPRDDEGSRGH